MCVAHNFHAAWFRFIKEYSWNVSPTYVLIVIYHYIHTSFPIQRNKYRSPEGVISFYYSFKLQALNSGEITSSRSTNYLHQKIVFKVSLRQNKRPGIHSNDFESWLCSYAIHPSSISWSLFFSNNQCFSSSEKILANYFGRKSKLPIYDQCRPHLEMPHTIIYSRTTDRIRPFPNYSVMKVSWWWIALVSNQ